MKMRQCKNNKLNMEQKQFILDNYATMSNKEIAEKIGIKDVQLIRSYAKNNKIRKNDEVKMVKHGIYNKIILKDHSYIYSSMFLKLEPKVENLYKSKYGKYSVNQDYFEIIDNEWKAYWLGFLYADGCVRLHKKSNNKTEAILKIALAKVDKQHLDKFLNSIQSNAIIKFREIKFNGKIYESAEVNICNMKICQDLTSHGCFENKSLLLKFPSVDEVPKKYLRHFIRGYFDGDGCVHVNTKNKSTIVNFVGTKDFLEKLNEILSYEIGLPKLKLIKKQGQKAYQLSYGGIEEFEKIFEFLYKDSNICLDRKLNKFKIIL